MRRWPVASLLTLAQVAACGGSTTPATAPVVASEVTDAPLPAPVEAPRDGESRDGKSVTLLRFGDVAFAADGPPVQRGRGRMTWQPERRLAIGASDVRVQIETLEDGARLALWVERDDLATVAKVATRLALTPGERGSTGDAGVTVFEGTPLAIVERRGDAVRVTNQVEARPGEDLSFEGWLDASLLGTHYMARERVAAEPAMDAMISVDDGTVMLDAPGGRTVATFRSYDDMDVMFGVERLGPERDGFVLAEFRRPGFVAVGWVPMSYRGAPGPGGGGRGEGMGFDVPPGTCLYAAEGGAAVGEAIEVVELYGDGPTDAGWWAAELGSSWGMLPVWIQAVPDGYARCDGGVALTAALEAADDAGTE